MLHSSRTLKRYDTATSSLESDDSDSKQASNNLLQVFFVRQEGSWTSLDISRELFEDFVHVFAAFSPVWNCMFTFGKKSTEHECEFPGFKSRGPSTILGHSAIGLSTGFEEFVKRLTKVQNRPM